MHAFVLALASRVLQRRAPSLPPLRPGALRPGARAAAQRWRASRRSCLTWSLSYWGGNAATGFRPPHGTAEQRLPEF